MKGLTNRQRQILDFIKEFILVHKYPPSIREIASEFNISSSGAHDHLKALVRKGEISFDSNRSRAIDVKSLSSGRSEILDIPILGNVAAGLPLLAEENLEGYIQVAASALKDGIHFALHIQGDSMQDAGILDGDIAVFIQKNTADNGDIVIARINDEAVTLKRFFKEKNRIRLKAENPVYPPIYSQNVKILGKLQFIFRNYD